MLKSLTTRNDNPFNVWQNEMKNMLEKFSPKDESPFFTQNDFPNVEIKESDKGFSLKAEVPGMDDDDITVSLRDDCLILEGERRTDREEEDEDYYFSEFSYGSFYRTIPLGEKVNPDTVSASCKDGILTVEMDKIEHGHRKKKKIEINKH
jgi:HSP20 family protein